MKETAVKKLAEMIGAVAVDGDGGGCSGISIDSRTVEKGDCFFAIEGENFDGHKFVDKAFENGAVCAVVNANAKVSESLDGTILKVDDTVKALGLLAKEYRAQAGFKVVGITGSVGKTTTRQMISQILGGRFVVHQSPKNFNNFIGLPLTLLGADVGTQIVVAELGSNSPGEIAYLTGIARPDIAVVTMVCPAHLEGFGDIETITAEKSSIADGLADGGEFFINGDIEMLVESCRAKGRKFKTFGRSEKCDVQAKDVKLTGTGSEFTIDGVRIELGLAGEGNVLNVLGAWSVCGGLGVSIAEFAAAVKGLTAIDMRMEVERFGELVVVNDCYNANPASMKNALDILKRLGSEGGRRKVFVCGEMAELGAESERLHTELGEAVVRAGVDVLIAVGGAAMPVADAAKYGGVEIKYFKDADSACNKLQESIKDSDIVLVKASRVSGLEVVVERLKKLYS